MTDSTKLNPYVVTLVVIGLTGLGGALILAGLSASPSLPSSDPAALAALLAGTQIALFVGLGGILGALVVAGVRWQPSARAAPERTWSISYPDRTAGEPDSAPDRRS